MSRVAVSLPSSPSFAASVPHLPPALPGNGYVIEDRAAGRLQCYSSEPRREDGSSTRPPSRREPVPGSQTLPLLLVHSVNAAASAFEVRPLFEHYSTKRPTYAFDLPGFGLSERSKRPYTPQLMTSALDAVVTSIQEREGDQPIDILGLSLGCELVARAITKRPKAFRSVALVSPTGMSGTKRRAGEDGSTRAIPGMHTALSLLDDTLFKLLTKPSVIRFFLEKTWGGKEIDEALWAYDVLLTQQPGAKHAPLAFLSGHLFSNDISRVYESLDLPVWMAHGNRGDFVDYRGADAFKQNARWSFKTYDAGAMPYFEMTERFCADYDAFLASVATS